MKRKQLCMIDACSIVAFFPITINKKQVIICEEHAINQMYDAGHTIEESRNWVKDCKKRMSEIFEVVS